MIFLNSDFESIVNEARLVETLQAMVRLPSINPADCELSPGRGEALMADYFVDRLQRFGLLVEREDVRPGRPNVWGRLPGTGNGPTVLLAGHLDTVGVNGYEKPFDAQVANGRVYGRGACDMKGGLAAILEVVGILVESGHRLTGDLLVAGFADEEYGMTGSARFGKVGPKADFAIVAEPTSLALSPAHRGQLCIAARSFGLSAHSSVPERGMNAIYHMARCVGGIEQYARELKQRVPHALCGRPTVSVGTIRGGTEISTVPDFCEIEIDRRLVPGETLSSVREELLQVLAGAAIANEFSYELGDPILFVPPLETPAGSDLVKAVSQALAVTLNRPAEVLAFPGSSDAPNLGCPTVLCGPGALAQCHSLEEYVPIDELVMATRAFLHTILALQGAE